jgi:hypothetical protein
MGGVQVVGGLLVVAVCRGAKVTLSYDHRLLASSV